MRCTRIHNSTWYLLPNKIHSHISGATVRHIGHYQWKATFRNREPIILRTFKDAKQYVEDQAAKASNKAGMVDTKDTQ